ncbi:MAG: response regulator [Nitrospinae bacterium]|nr:response regulator [Nitrospinota bacterium]
MSSWLSSQLNPIVSLRARIALAIGLLTATLAAVLAIISANISLGMSERQVGESLNILAHSLSDTTEMAIGERLREIKLSATRKLMRDREVPLEEKRRILEDTQSAFKSYAWLGLTDKNGVCVAGTGEYLEGVDLSLLPWFIQGRSKPFLGDAHEAMLLAEQPPNPSGEMFYLLDVAVPVFDLNDEFMGVLGAYIRWEWMESLIKTIDDKYDVEIILLSDKGLVLTGLPQLHTPFAPLAPKTASIIGKGGHGYITEKWTDGKEYITGYTVGRRYPNAQGLGWTILVRDTTARAFASTYVTQRTIIALGAVLSVLFSIIGWIISGRIVKPVVAITTAAEAIANGDLSTESPVTGGRDEIARLGYSISLMTHNLVGEITIRRFAEEQLRLSEKVFENSREGIIITDENRRILRINKACSSIIGYDLPDAANVSFEIALPVTQQQDFYANVWHSVKNFGHWQGELFSKRKSGEIFPAWLIINSITDENGIITNYLGIFSDLTEVKRSLEAQMAREVAENSNALKDKFLNIVSHDLRSPLAGVSSLLEMMGADAGLNLAEQTRRQIVERMRNSVKSLLKLIDTLLDIGRLKSGKITLNQAFFNAREVIGYCVSNMDALAEKKVVSISNEIPEGLRLFCDPALFGEVIANLISNAIKFSQKGGTIHIFAPSERQSIIAIKDTGVGIAKDTLPNLFKHDVKTSTTGTAGERGTGLGLPYCHDLMVAMGGTISVESEIGKGSVFYVSIPDVERVILVVDDQEAQRKIIREYISSLEKIGFIEAVDGANGLQKLIETRPDLIITDLQMPRIDGFAFIRAVRQNSNLKNIPIIAVTSVISSAENESGPTCEQLALEAGADDIELKSYMAENILAKVQKLLPPLERGSISKVG